MTDLRKAAEMALEFVEWLCGDDHSVKPKNNALKTREALRQALAQEENPPVKSYCGGKPNYCTPVDAVNMTQERVEETAKREHEPYPEGDVVGPCICGSWPGGKCLKCKRIETAKLGHEPFIYVREDNERPFGGYEHCSEADAGAFPVYTAPIIYTPQPKREWVGLTDADIAQTMHGNVEGSNMLPYQFARAIEAKLKEKNT